jgi:hypothetical protein
MVSQRDKYIVEANVRAEDEQEWNWLTEAFGAVYCESQHQAMAVAHFLASHPAIEKVEVLRQQPNRDLESIWCSRPQAMRATREHLSQIGSAADRLGVDNPAFAEWLLQQRRNGRS